jgi:hypothetical protein
MSIVNRRNAMLGWITWEAGKRIAAQKARAAVQADEGASKKKKGLILSLLAAAGAILVFWRHKASDESPPGPE